LAEIYSHGQEGPKIGAERTIRMRARTRCPSSSFADPEQARCVGSVIALVPSLGRC
jgi:hypothetical protein